MLGAGGRRREDREDAIAEELQDLAVVLGDRIADAFEMLIEPADDLRSRSAVDERREASEIGEQQGGRNDLAVAATDLSLQHARSGLRPEIGAHGAIPATEGRKGVPIFQSPLKSRLAQNLYFSRRFKMLASAQPRTLGHYWDLATHSRR